MKKVIFIILAFIISIACIAQSDTVFIRYDKSEYDAPIQYTTDTIIYETFTMRKLLYKSMVLPLTLNQQIAKGYGLFLDSVAISPCANKGQGRPDYINEVQSVISTEDSLVIQINFWGNCCHHFLCDIEIVDTNTINIITIGYGGMYCSCDCCYGLSLFFEPLNDVFEDFKKLKYISINGDKKRELITNFF